MTNTLPPWPAALTDRLRTLWGQGMTASQIAGTLNCEFGLRLSRNAVVGKARRIKLDGRPSPILPPNPAHKQRDPRRLPRKPSGISSSRDLPPEPEPAPAPVLRPGSECRWTDSDRAPWVFCGATCLAGSSYCPEHHSRVWVHKSVKYVVKTAQKRRATEGCW